MTARLSKKPIALVAGASDRIGRAMALHLARHGYSIAITYRSNIKGAQESADLISQYSPVVTIPVELGTCNQPDMHSLIKEISCQLEAPVKLIIYSASFFERSNAVDLDYQHLLANFNIHTFAPMLMAQALYHHLQTFPQPAKGNFIAMCDQRVYRRTTTRVAYELSKKSLLEFCRIAALSFADSMRVNTISPGAILQATSETDEEFQRLISKGVPLKCQGSVENILQTLDFLLQCEYLTGVDIPVDGGEHLQG
ncbi:SDR family oxidoreductase [Desulfurispira natronophila]|uniref:NAD(P)-dependent dehydrogenase (Short-subunit alcohol dehydrogenase family) n=1 Tax=Desulfurispira natronophila TaxID=682562 RepID=A0A7W8DFY8_9BACT|nr:SDR family oxidoreductase [Desulfurispira natronophila]MBB5020926.1 NAD(P)-dependent dehydrogenase (short-subunit alcohol dehydrogenase family) [Desulfurispira natronophila]